MTIQFGDLRAWRSSALSAASEMLLADIKVLQASGDTVETDAIPAAYQGWARMPAEARQALLVQQMAIHVDALTSFERAVYSQVAAVAAIERATDDIDSDAAAQQFSVSYAGEVTDVAEPKTFEVPAQADEYAETRRAQRDALVARVNDVLDDAYAVDSALIAARPQGSFSDAGPEYVADPEVAREWASMSEEERRAVIVQIAEERAKEAGVEDFEVKFADLDDEDGDGVDDDPDSDSRGSWSDKSRVLSIDVGNLDDPTILGTVAHEVRHAVQHKAVDDLPGWPWEDYTNTTGISEEEARRFKENFDHPKNSEDDGFEAYHDQATERDAREAGADYLDGLDKDDLDRIREEAK